MSKKVSYHQQQLKTLLPLFSSLQNESTLPSKLFHSKGRNKEVPPGDAAVQDPALSLLGQRSDPRPENFHTPQVRPKKKKKIKKQKQKGRNCSLSQIYCNKNCSAAHSKEREERKNIDLIKALTPWRATSNLPLQKKLFEIQFNKNQL